MKEKGVIEFPEVRYVFEGDERKGERGWQRESDVRVREIMRELRRVRRMEWGWKCRNRFYAFCYELVSVFLWWRK